MMTSSNGNIFLVTGHLCGEFTGPRWITRQRLVMRSFDVFFDLRLNKRLSKQSWGWWLETLRAHYDDTVMNIKTWSYQFKDSYVKDKTISRPSYLQHGNPHTWKDSLHIETGPWLQIHKTIFKFSWSVRAHEISRYLNILYDIRQVQLVFFTYLFVCEYNFEFDCLL